MIEIRAVWMLEKFSKLPCFFIYIYNLFSRFKRCHLIKIWEFTSEAVYLFSFLSFQSWLLTRFTCCISPRLLLQKQSNQYQNPVEGWSRSRLDLYSRMYCDKCYNTDLEEVRFFERLTEESLIYPVGLNDWTHRAQRSVQLWDRCSSVSPRVRGQRCEICGVVSLSRGDVSTVFWVGLSAVMLLSSSEDHCSYYVNTCLTSKQFIINASLNFCASYLVFHDCYLLELHFGGILFLLSGYS